MDFKLNKNDTIGIIAPSGRINDLNELEESKKLIESLGYNVKIFDGCYFVHQTDEHKILELEQAFNDNYIKAIICARGGYGTLRLLDSITYQTLMNSPKIFAGSSDITTLLLQINKMCGFKTFHSPMLVGNGKFNKTTFLDFIKTVNGEKKQITPKKNFKVLRKGEAHGTLWGGNLSMIVSMFGSYSSSFVPNRDIIMFLEDLNEPFYKIDRMLTQIYRNERLRRRIKGIIFGDFLNSDDKERMEEALIGFAQKVDVPSAYGYPITHNKTNYTVPIGQLANFNTKDGIVNFEDEPFS